MFLVLLVDRTPYMSEVLSDIYRHEKESRCKGNVRMYTEETVTRADEISKSWLNERNKNS
jgi:predicted fused transcriptional regulator/phosphomethylpyrimidine kinase